MEGSNIWYQLERFYNECKKEREDTEDYRWVILQLNILTHFLDPHYHPNQSKTIIEYESRKMLLLLLLAAQCTRLTLRSSLFPLEDRRLWSSYVLQIKFLRLTRYLLRHRLASMSFSSEMINSLSASTQDALQAMLVQAASARETQSRRVTAVPTFSAPMAPRPSPSPVHASFSAYPSHNFSLNPYLRS